MENRVLIHARDAPAQVSHEEGLQHHVLQDAIEGVQKKDEPQVPVVESDLTAFNSSTHADEDKSKDSEEARKEEALP